MKKLLVLFLALILCLAMPLSAAADAIIYDPEGNINLLECWISSERCKGLNIFLSNYAELNIPFFPMEDDDAINYTLKHFELNGPLYSGVSCKQNDSGEKYMEIEADTFKSKAKQLFNVNVTPSMLSGYKLGKIYASAENYGAPITVFAVATGVDFNMKNNYTATFDVYLSEGEIANRYSLTPFDLPTGKVEKIGSGKCSFYYYGPKTQDTFKASDFVIANYVLEFYNEDKFPYTNTNNWGIPDSSTTSDVVISTPVNDTLSDKADNATWEGSNGISIDTTTLIIVGAAIIGLAIVILVIILICFRKKL